MDGTNYDTNVILKRLKKNYTTIFYDLINNSLLQSLTLK